MDDEIWIIKIYYSLLKSYMAVQICNRDFCSRKLEEKWEGGGGIMFPIKGVGTFE